MVLSLVSCKQECNEEAGKIIQKELEVASFNAIIVNTGIKLVVKESIEQQVIVEAGENRFDNFHTIVTDNTLELQADGPCFFSPSLDPVIVYISSPNLEYIRNSSDYSISSDGVLNFPKLQLYSEDHENNYSNFGNFDLAVNNDNLSIVSNGLSVFTISGNTTNLNIQFYSGIGKFEGKDLVATHVNIYHRGDNSLKVNPQQSLKGGLYSTGNVISYNRPPIVEVEEYFTGKLIFE